MHISRTRPRLATVLAVAVIGALSLGLTGAGSADAGNDKTLPPPAQAPSSAPAATMLIHPSSGDDISTPVSSFQFGVGIGVSSPSTGRETSPPSLSEITVTRETDSNSPVLFSYITRGTTLPEVTFTGALPDGTPVVYELTDVILSGMSTSTGGSGWSESLSLNFVKLTTTVGANSASYDLATRTAS